MESKKLSASISSSGGKSNSCELNIRFLPPEERRKQALKSLALFWALSIGTIPLPPIHWVTVPFFFGFGIYSFQKKLREKQLLAACNLDCPECGRSIPCSEQSLSMPIAITCPHCRFNLKLQEN